MLGSVGEKPLTRKLFAKSISRAKQKQSFAYRFGEFRKNKSIFYESLTNSTHQQMSSTEIFCVIYGHEIKLGIIIIMSAVEK